MGRLTPKARAVSASGLTTAMSWETTPASVLTMPPLLETGTPPLPNAVNPANTCSTDGLSVWVKPKVLKPAKKPDSDEKSNSVGDFRSLRALVTPCGIPLARAVTTSTGLMLVGKSPIGVGTLAGPGLQPLSMLP